MPAANIYVGADWVVPVFGLAESDGERWMEFGGGLELLDILSPVGYNQL